MPRKRTNPKSCEFCIYWDPETLQADLAQTVKEIPKSFDELGYCHLEPPQPGAPDLVGDNVPMPPRTWWCRKFNPGNTDFESVGQFLDDNPGLTPS